VKIGFLQLNNGFSGQHYLPLAVGMLASHLKSNLDTGHDIDLAIPEVFFDDNDLIARRLAGCNIIAASVYVWNEQNTLDICRRVKELNPKALIVFGGPQVPNAYKQFRRIKSTSLSHEEINSERYYFTEDYHRRYPFIDFCVHGEGERVFTSLVKTYLLSSKDDCFELPSVSGIDNKGNFSFHSLLPRMRTGELEMVPSPILDGFFDLLIQAYPNQRWNLMYETDRGCPYQCTYCDWGGATEDKVTRFSLDRIQREIDWIGSRSIEYVFLANANFGILERDVEIAELFVKARAIYGFPRALSTQNAKNPKAHTIKALKVLEEGGLNKATVMSQQSLNPETLRHVRRENMKLDQYYEIQASLGAQGIFTMTDMIFPMPGETKESFLTGIDVLISNGQFNRIQFNNLSILVNTEMGNPEYQRRFGMRLTQVPIINPHGERSFRVNSVSEVQTLVTATASMPEKDWLEVRAFSWLLNFLFFNKLVQIPILLVSEITGKSTTEVIRGILRSSRDGDILTEVYGRLMCCAEDLQLGIGNEFIHSPEFLDVFWPPDELEHIRLVSKGDLARLYLESFASIVRFLEEFELSGEQLDLIKEAHALNEFLIIVPRSHRDVWVLRLEHDLLSWYLGKLRGEDHPASSASVRVVYSIPTSVPDSLYDLSSWCEQVVWFGNRRGAYIHTNVETLEEVL
jgi:radical SAM superfamily enzyme YgiQ (UPF0313 family)